MTHLSITEKWIDRVVHNCYPLGMFLRRLGDDPHANGAQTPSLQGCPDVWELNDGDFAVIGKDMTEFANQLPDSAGCGPDERMVRVPRRILVSARRDISETV